MRFENNLRLIFYYWPISVRQKISSSEALQNPLHIKFLLKLGHLILDFTYARETNLLAIEII